jgi:hypothetical protein
MIALLGSALGLIGLQGLRPLHAQSPSGQGAASGQRVSETEPLAQSLGYKEDASKVDKAKFPTYKPGETCAKCRFYQGTTGQAYGPCQIFSGKLVNSNGWCASFNAKT